MGKKIRLEFEYSEINLNIIKEHCFLLGLPKITIITRMTEHDISEGPTKIVECTEIIHEN